MYPQDVLFEGVGLFEAPTWDGDVGIYFSNVTAGGVYRLDTTDRSVVCVVEHRKGIGGLALTRDGDLVVSGRNVALKRRSGETEVLFDSSSIDRPVIGFNDLTVAPDGKIVVGALGPGSLNPHAVEAKAHPPPIGAGTGAFYEVGRDGARLLADDIGHPNGVAFAPGGARVYVSDSLRRCVYRFDAGPCGWSERSVFARFDHGLPDGMAVATDGSLWLALALRGEIVVLEPDGTLRERLATSMPLTTSVHFGGADLRAAMLTSGSHGGSDPAQITTLRSPVAGLPVPRAGL